MPGPRAGGPFERWARGAVSQLSGHVAIWAKGSGLDGRGRLQSRALETEKVGREVHGGPGKTPITASPHLSTNHTPDLYLQRKRKQLLPRALWYKGP